MLRIDVIIIIYCMMTDEVYQTCQQRQPKSVVTM